MKIRKPWLVAALALLVVLVMRELGWVSLNLYTSRLAEESDSTTHDIGDKVHVWTVEVIDASVSEGNAVHAAPSQGRDDFRGEITEFDLSGPYWLPLFKTGEFTYKARLTRSGDEIGDASGTMTLKIWGLCSAREFRAQAHAAVEKSLRDTIEARVPH